MKITISKEWFESRVNKEETFEIGAGNPAHFNNQNRKVVSINMATPIRKGKGGKLGTKPKKAAKPVKKAPTKPSQKKPAKEAGKVVKKLGKKK